MGIPSIQAPSEGEAEAVYLTKKGWAWATASQDYDALLYGAPVLIRNLTMSKRKRIAGGNYIDVNIEQVKTSEVLEELGINQDQLICLAILIGTDYNINGVKGIGQKRALEIVKEHKTPEEIFKFIEDSEKYELEFNWQEILKIFKEYESEIKEMPEFPQLDQEKIKEILIRYEFSENRIESALEKLQKITEQKKQKGLSEFF
jgi:flap endonuclease-1